MNVNFAIHSIRALLPATVAAFAALLPGSASAAYVATLSFVQPTGIVGPNDTVAMRVRLTLAAGSEPLVLSTDGSATPPFGVPLANYPTTATSYELEDEGVSHYELVGFDSLSYVGFGGAFMCNDTFTAGTCSEGPYRFEFDFSSPDSPFASSFLSAGLNLQVGESIETAFGKLVPNGPVAAGTYYAYDAALRLVLMGSATFRIQATDDQGNPVFDESDRPVWLPDFRSADAYGDIPLASTPCASNADPSCAGAFSRTVVPLPGAAWLFGTALGTLAWRLGRRR